MPLMVTTLWWTEPLFSRHFKF